MYEKLHLKDKSYLIISLLLLMIDSILKFDSTKTDNRVKIMSKNIEKESKDTFFSMVYALILN